MTLTFDGTLVDHFAEEGYKPEFGARELKRLIRSELETALAREMLGGGIGKGDHAHARWDDKAERVAFDRKQPAPTSAEAPSGSAQPPGPPGVEQGDAQEEVRKWQGMKHGAALILKMGDGQPVHPGAASLRARGEYAPHPVVTTCWSADIARQMTTCFGMDEGLDWRKRRSDRDF